MRNMAAKTKTHGQLIAEELNSNPTFREEWEATAVARVVAAKLIDYRAEHKLSQRKLAVLLGVKQPFVARLEMAESNPEVDTLIRISRTLGIEFMLDIAPAKRAPKLITKRVREQHATAEREGVSVTFAAA
jgi:transcriptional regulator with XRE-family HTH domain